MNRRLLLLVLLASGQATLAPLQAQHAPFAEDGVVQPGYQSCALCHDLHDQASEAYSLRLRPLPMVINRDHVPQIDAISRSCLRCHLTNDFRETQPEFAGGGTGRTEEHRLLGFDLTDDHPVGEVEPAATFQRGPTGDGLSVRDVFKSGSLNPSLKDQDLRCTTCHDPHDRFGGNVQPEAEAALCGYCHAGQSLGLNDHLSLVCSDCHASHAGHGQLLMREPTVPQLCDSCHDPVGVSAASRDHRSSIPHAQPRHDEYANQDCLTCHITHR